MLLFAKLQLDGYKRFNLMAYRLKQDSRSRGDCVVDANVGCLLFGTDCRVFVVLQVRETGELNILNRYDGSSPRLMVSNYGISAMLLLFHVGSWIES